MELAELLNDLSNAFGPSGFEGEVREVFKRSVAECAEITYDNLGGIIATHQGSSSLPKILLAAHLDEVGLMVRGILPNGYLKVVPLGSWFTPALLAQQVLIRSKNGLHVGVIGSKPPHYMSEDERNRQLKFTDLYIDVGAKNSTEIEALGIEVGNPVVPAVKAEVLSEPDTIIGKAFDDRAGCAVIIQVLRELDHDHPNQVIGAGTAQEENGIKGARTISAITQPDLCLVLEGAPADDFPDAQIIQGRLGGGPQIRRFDPSMIANQALVELAVQEAQKLGIPYQVAVREGGGTDGSEIQLQANGGVPAAVIGVPVRYAHSHHGIVSLKDVEATVQLVRKMLQRLDQTIVENLKRNPWEFDF